MSRSPAGTASGSARVYIYKQTALFSVDVYNVYHCSGIMNRYEFPTVTGWYTLCEDSFIAYDDTSSLGALLTHTSRLYNMLINYDDGYVSVFFVLS